MPAGLIAGTSRQGDPMLCTSKSRHYQDYISAEATRLQMNAGEKQGDARISLAFSLCSASFAARILAKFPTLLPLMLFSLCRAVLSTSTSHDVQDSGNSESLWGKEDLDLMPPSLWSGLISVGVGGSRRDITLKPCFAFWVTKA